MAIVLGILFVIWGGVFGFLWEYALKNIDGWWGALLPVSWFILAPCILIQLGL